MKKEAGFFKKKPKNVDGQIDEKAKSVALKWTLYLTLAKVAQLGLPYNQCDQNGRFIGLWATF